MFDPLNFGIDCDYTAAPPKTKARAQRKAELDYQESIWPRSANVLDFVRGSVVFANSSDLLKGINKFIDIITNNNDEKNDNNGNNNNSNNNNMNEKSRKLRKNHCIKRIVRIKNGFDQFQNVSTLDDNQLNKFNYCDVKFNILIEWNSVRIIGEIQFLLKWMLEAKKLGHSIYSFVRNKHYYTEINDLIVNIDKKFETNKLNKIKEIEKIAVQRNVSLMYTLLQGTNETEKTHFWIEKESQLRKMFVKNRWEKGLKLYDLFLNSWKVQF